MSYFLGLAGTLQDARVSAERIYKILDEKEEPEGEDVLDELDHISVHDLTISYNEGCIFEDLNLSLQKGKLYGIAGKNGGGKTTLINALIGLFSGEHSGELYYDDIDIQSINMEKMKRKNISYLEQDPVFFNMKVEEYIKFGIDTDEDIEEKRTSLLKELRIDYLPNKDINKNGNNFSGGEKQKIALARILSKKSSLILLDEPTSALDKESTEQLMNSLMEKKKNAIIIMISHDPVALNYCDEIINV